MTPKGLVKALFPLWGTVLVLFITRAPFLGLNSWLTSAEVAWSVGLGSLGELRVSPSLVVELRNIFETEVAWRHAFLYVPSLLPFFFVSALCVPLFRMPQSAAARAWGESYERMKGPVVAFLGALVFSKLLISGGDRSSAAILGDALSGAIGSAWPLAAAYVGALGAFVSGSNTIANLTFGPIQDAAAATLGLDRTTILALQSAGGAMGNMVALQNIVAVCSILGLGRQEGAVLKKTVGPMLAYGVVAALMSAFL